MEFLKIFTPVFAGCLMGIGILLLMQFIDRKMKGTKKPKPTKPKSNVVYHAIIVNLKNGRTAEYTKTFTDVLDIDKKSPMHSYIDFYKWFYFRKSPAYTMSYSKGIEIILRDQITGVRMYVN